MGLGFLTKHFVDVTATGVHLSLVPQTSEPELYSLQCGGTQTTAGPTDFLHSDPTAPTHRTSDKILGPDTRNPNQGSLCSINTLRSYEHIVTLCFSERTVHWVRRSEKEALLSEDKAE